MSYYSSFQYRTGFITRYFFQYQTNNNKYAYNNKASPGPVQTKSGLVSEIIGLVQPRSKKSLDYTGLDRDGSSLHWSTPGPVQTLTVSATVY